MDYRVLTQEVINLINGAYKKDKTLINVKECVERSVAKYGTTTNKLSLMIAGDVEYKKILWQIIVDLRYARGTDLQFDQTEDYANEKLILRKITDLIEEQTDEFSRPGSSLINVSELDKEAYEAIVKELELR